ncbi:MAG: T9SS type A sorting domain-containing protein [Bacteroidales bacterium]|nr:T9SS type A sorting domain-containing protein [Bacteroidales bacterium]
MKKTFLFYLLLALAFLKANAQTYQYVPFPTENAVWSEDYSYDSYYYYPQCYFLDKIALNGDDTHINGETYKKLFIFNDSVFNINNANYFGGIREENKRIYYYGDTVHFGKPNNCLNEVLLYDFNLNVGDTFISFFNQIDSTYCSNSNWDVVVSSIDTIILGNKLRKRFIFNDFFTQWIEGIGNVRGLLLSIPPWITGNVPQGNLICFKQNDTIVYFNNQFSECMPLNIPTKPAISDNIAISPNPATDFLTLKIENFELLPFTFQLYDMQGCSQLAGKTSNTQTELNVATLPRGLYVLKIITDKQIITKKVVLQ